MNILLIMEHFTKGGFESHIVNYIESLDSKINFKLVIGNYKCENTKISNLKVKEDMPLFSSLTVERFVDLIDELCEIVYKEKIDLIHAQPFKSFFLASVVSQITEKPLIYTSHGFGSFTFPSYQIELLIFRHLFKTTVSHTYIVSNNLIEYAKNLTDENNVFLLSNGFNKKIHNIYKSVNNKKWVCVSRLDGDRFEEIKYLIENFNRINIDEIDIFGSGSKESEILNLINVNNLEEKIHLKGWSNNIIGELKTGYNGGLGIGRSASELLFCGLPVILCGDGNVGPVIKDENYTKIFYSNFTNRYITKCSIEKLNNDLDDLYKNGRSEKLDLLTENLCSELIFEEFYNNIKQAELKKNTAIILWINKLKEVLLNNPIHKNDLFYESKIVKNTFYSTCKYRIHNLSDLQFFKTSKVVDSEINNVIKKYAKLENSVKELRVENQNLKKELRKLKKTTTKLNGYMYKTNIKTIILNTVKRFLNVVKNEKK